MATAIAARGAGRPTPAELAAQVRVGTAPIVVDVRSPAEFETAHIAGSHNLPLDQLRAYGARLAASGPLVLVCRIGERSREAERVLRVAGHESATSLDGGMAAWERAGLPLVRGRERWSIERQVRGVAGSLVLVGALGGLVVARPIGALAAAIGGGLVFSALTDFCGMAKLLALLPYNRESSADLDATVAAVVAGRPAA